MILFDVFQKRLEQQNAKSSSEKFNCEEDGGSGFPIEPSRGSLQYGMYNGRSKQPDEPHVEHYKHRGAQLTKFSNSLAWHGSSRLDRSKGTSSHWPEDRPNGKYHQLNDADSSHSHSMLDEPNCSYKKHEHAPLKVSDSFFVMKQILLGSVWISIKMNF